MRSLVIQKLLSLLGEMRQDEMEEFIRLINDDASRSSLLKILSDLQSLGKEQGVTSANRRSTTSSLPAQKELPLEEAIRTESIDNDSILGDDSAKIRFEYLLNDKDRFPSMSHLESALAAVFGKEIVAFIRSKDSRSQVASRIWRSLGRLPSSKKYKLLASFFRAHSNKENDDYERLFKMLSRQ